MFAPCKQWRRGIMLWAKRTDVPKGRHGHQLWQSIRKDEKIRRKTQHMTGDDIEDFGDMMMAPGKMHRLDTEESDMEIFWQAVMGEPRRARSRGWGSPLARTLSLTS